MTSTRLTVWSCPQHLTADGTVLRTLRWMPDGSKQEFGPDGKLLRVIPRGVHIKKAKSDVIRYVPSTPERVAVIKRMFEWCIAGYGYHYIAAKLNEEGVVSPGGAPWNTARIGKILKNPVYRGAIAWNRRTMGSLFGLDGQGKLRPKTQKGWLLNEECDWIISEGVHEPLVSPEEFEQARRAIAKRRREGGKARSTKRSLLASLMVCTNCGHNFVQRHDRRWPGPRGEGYRYYSDAGYHRGGKAVCKLLYLPADALDEFVLNTIKRLMLADHETTKQAIEAFVKSVMRPRKTSDVQKSSKRDLDLLNRKIKATLSMLADPAFDALDELRDTLADLNAKRDGLQARLKPEKPAKPQMSEKELRQWALQQFAKLDQLIANRTSELADRQLVESYVERIEIDPSDKTGVLYVRADLQDALLSSSTRGPITESGGATAVQFSLDLAIAAETLDQVQRTVPLKPFGIATSITSGGTSDASTTAWVEVPNTMLFQSSRMRIHVSPGVQRSLLDIVLPPPAVAKRRAVERLANTDSLSSDLMAAIALQKMLRIEPVSDAAVAPSGVGTLPNAEQHCAARHCVGRYFRFSIAAIMVVTAVVALMLFLWRISPAVLWIAILGTIAANVFGYTVGWFFTYVLRLPNDGKLRWDPDETDGNQGDRDNQNDYGRLS